MLVRWLSFLIIFSQMSFVFSSDDGSVVMAGGDLTHGSLRAPKRSRSNKKRFEGSQVGSAGYKNNFAPASAGIPAHEKGVLLAFVTRRNYRDAIQFIRRELQKNPLGTNILRVNANKKHVFKSGNSIKARSSLGIIAKIENPNKEQLELFDLLVQVHLLFSTVIPEGVQRSCDRTQAYKAIIERRIGTQLNTIKKPSPVAAHIAHSSMDSLDDVIAASLPGQVAEVAVSGEGQASTGVDETIVLKDSPLENDRLDVPAKTPAGNISFVPSPSREQDFVDPEADSESPSADEPAPAVRSTTVRKLEFEEQPTDDGEKVLPEGFSPIDHGNSDKNSSAVKIDPRPRANMLSVHNAVCVLCVAAAIYFGNRYGIQPYRVKQK